MSFPSPQPHKVEEITLSHRFAQVRATSIQICQPLETEDYVIQSMPDVSPPKWHLAHTTWFYETFILKPYFKDYREFHPQYSYLFNSYYQNVGPRHSRNHRGLLSRPILEDIFRYREYVDEAILTLLDGDFIEDVADRLVLGLHHEQQHQELLLTDIKHILGSNPLLPTYSHGLPANFFSNSQVELLNDLKWQSFKGGLFRQGSSASANGQKHFIFDNESPVHQTFVNPFQVATRLVTNQEYLAFIEDKGYEQPDLWLDDGWHWIQRHRLAHPLYWHYRDGQWHEFTLYGLQALPLAHPVIHVSFYEADAFARWQGKRLLTESEWELIALQYPLKGQFFEQQQLHPSSIGCNQPEASLEQLFGYAWEWTQSDYAPYPGFKPAEGALGEYNGKFMCNQKVLRGGSLATSETHFRKTYRNFFYPHSQWQFTGIRLAESL
ncbi:MAG: ergothioneine biosynthesis protein EgtB [Pseudomonadota bacterium]